MRAETKFRLDVSALVALSLGSLVLDRATDRFLLRVLSPALDWIRTLHLVPLALAVALYILCGPNETWKFPREIKRSWLVVPIWIAMVAAVYGLSLLVVKDQTKSEIALRVADFMVFHIVAMELLFRGALPALAGRIWPAGAKDFGDISFKTLLVTTLVFGLSQLQYNPTLWASAPWWQAFRAFCLGLFMCMLRGSTRSVWTSVIFHAGSNLLGALH